MIILTKLQILDIQKHILACYPNEACGILVSDIFIPLTNIAEKPLSSFKIDILEITKYLGNIQAIIHSHTRDIKETEIFDLRTPSWADIVGQRQSNIPWLIFGTEGHSVTDFIEIPRIKHSNYLERPFIWYINDCFSLVQDYYLFELGIELPDHKAEADFKDIRKIHDIFAKHIKDYGFIELPTSTELQKGDLLLLDTIGCEKNHLGIYDGEGNILHQDTLSIKEPFVHFINRFHSVLRYVG